jgi:membrane-associated phospholipid phosphatase
MTIFPTNWSIQVYTALAVAALIWLGTGRQPLHAIRGFIREMVAFRRHLFYLLAALAILLVNAFELKLENAYGVSYDLTAALTGWEGAWQSWLQTQVQSVWLTVICAIFYVVVFQSIIIASLVIYMIRSDKKLYIAYCVTLLLNYAIALPMYWFIPVNEAWYANDSIRFLMLDVYPGFEQEYRNLSGLNNCFPSLHTSISVSMALLASLSGIRRWNVICWASAAIVVFSIFYLGIHWFSDMISGLMLAVIAVTIGWKMALKTAGTGRAKIRPDIKKAVSDSH